MGRKPLAAWNLAAYRRSKGLNQRNAAKAFGISESQWSRIEHGQSMPSPKLAVKLMRGTGVSLYTLMGIAL